jgi:hypothetical protein
MTSSEAFVETLVAHDTRHIFGIVGSAFMDALDIFEPAGIRFVSVQHEQNAVFVFQLLSLLLFFLIHSLSAFTDVHA